MNLQTFKDYKLKDQYFLTYLVTICALYLIWAGGLKLTPPELGSTEHWVKNSGLLHPLLNMFTAFQLNIFSLVVEIAAGLLLIAGLKKPNYLKYGALLAMGIFAFNFLYLFTNPVWKDDLGGFPIIGAGQGIIKYVSMFAVAYYLYSRTTNSAQHKKLSLILAWAGILIVMFWIGIMKFYEFEAKGITDLLNSNIFFSWIYQVWDIRGGSNFIGIVELIFGAGILLFPLSKLLGRLGVLGIALTALGTFSFMMSLPGWSSDSSFPLLNGSGMFILKDQLLLAAAIILWQEVE